MPDSSPVLLDAAFLHQLEGLRLALRRPLIGREGGARRSLRRGASLEFADFREYAPGDDLRYVDWKAYGRLEKLFLKQFQAEEDLRLHAFIDTSRSMSFGVPISKLDCAKRVAAALGYLALAGGERVGVAALSETGAERLPTLRGRAGVLPLLRFLEALKAGSGEAMFGHVFGRELSAGGASGLAVVLSDFFGEASQTGWKALAGRGWHVVLLHVLAPEEMEPTLAGEARLIDSETGDAREVSLSPFVLEQYRARVEAFCAEIKGGAARCGWDYVRVVSDAPLSETFLDLRKSGVLVR